MILLAVDTSGESQGIALMEEGRLLAEHREPSVSSHSETLLPNIANLLKQEGLAPTKIDVFALTVGPGSFTGLRIGIATIKGLAAAHDRPVVPISTLQALAEPQLARAGQVFSILDARMNEVFILGLGVREASAPTVLLEESCLSLPDAIRTISQHPGVKHLLGSGAQKFAEEFGPMEGVEISTEASCHAVSAAAVARLAQVAWKRGEFVPWGNLAARYWRASEAENRLYGLKTQKSLNLPRSDG